MRDARIAQIYEGANGIQALDLMGRKTVRSKGELLDTLSAEMDEFVASQKEVEAMQPYLAAFEKSRKCLAEATASVLAKSAEDPNEVGAASYSYMELMGLVLYCYMWQRMLSAAIADRDGESADADYADALIKTGQFFMQRLLPRTESLLAEITSGAESLMAMEAEQF